MQIVSIRNVYHFSGLEKQNHFHIEVIYVFFPGNTLERKIKIGCFDWLKFKFCFKLLQRQR